MCVAHTHNPVCPTPEGREATQPLKAESESRGEHGVNHAHCARVLLFADSAKAGDLASRSHLGTNNNEVGGSGDGRRGSLWLVGFCEELSHT